MKTYGATENFRGENKCRVEHGRCVVCKTYVTTARVCMGGDTVTVTTYEVEAES